MPAELDPDLKIMFITGFAAVILNNDIAAPKDARVLSKPFHLKDLVREVDRLLGRLKRKPSLARGAWSADIRGAKSPSEGRVAQR